MLIVASASPRRLLENIWRDSLTQTGYAFSIHDFARECTAAEIASIVATARAAKSANIVGVGDGKVLDAARATIDSEFVHNEPFPVTANMVADAIMAADAAFLGITGTNYQVVDGSRQYSVMDIYADFNGNYDKLVNYYGVTSHTGFVRTSLNGALNTGSSLLPSNGAAFAQASGTGWMPSASAASNAWDSFVTIGARTQDYTASSITADPNFSNGNTVGASTVAGGNNSCGLYQGAGWYTAAPLDIADLAGTYTDKRIMLGRFSVETTNMLTTDVPTIQFKGNVTMKVNGTSASSGTTSQPFFDQTFTYGYVPAPGAIALLGLAGLMARRRR